MVVIDVTLRIADDGLRAPHVIILSTSATAKDARSVCLGNAPYSHGQQGGVVGQQQVAASLHVCFQRTLGGSGTELCRQGVDSRSVNHHPEGADVTDTQRADS